MENLVLADAACGTDFALAVDFEVEEVQLTLRRGVVADASATGTL